MPRGSTSVPVRRYSRQRTLPRGDRGADFTERPGVALTITIPEAFTIDEAARRLGFRHRSTVYDLISRGELSACRLGRGSLRVPADALIDYLQRAMLSG
jgi:excisionase family DNA binding protein